MPAVDAASKITFPGLCDPDGNPWNITPEEIHGCGEVCGVDDDYDFADEICEATELIYAYSGWQFPGCCQTAIRPCRESNGCGCDTCAGPVSVPVLENGVWRNVPCGCDPYGGCCDVESLQLWPAPVHRIISVTIDGLPFEDWQLVNNSQLVRCDGGTWPECQDRCKPATAEGPGDTPQTACETRALFPGPSEGTNYQFDPGGVDIQESTYEAFVAAMTAAGFPSWEGEDGQYWFCADEQSGQFIVFANGSLDSYYPDPQPNPDFGAAPCPGTFEICYEYGVMPPKWVRRAAITLARELACLCYCPKKCRLPSTWESYSRDGVNLKRRTLTTADLQAGLTGVAVIDRVISYFGVCGRPRTRQSRVLSPDLAGVGPGSLGGPWNVTQTGP